MPALHFFIYINTKPQEGAKLMVSMGETPCPTVAIRTSFHAHSPTLRRARACTRGHGPQP
jgi:hypothetical protein